MPPLPAAAPLFVLDHALPVGDDGVVLLPGLLLHQPLARGEALRLRLPDGSTVVVVTGGRSFPVRDPRDEGPVRCRVVVPRALSPSDLPRGTEVWRMDAPGAPAGPGPTG
jgi:hypothetical protein